VRSRLMDIEGVDAFLSYLGFVKDEESQKLLCPDDQPPKSVIFVAHDVCKQFIDQAKEKEQTLKELRKISHTSKTFTNFSQSKNGNALLPANELKALQFESNANDSSISLTQFKKV